MILKPLSSLENLSSSENSISIVTKTCLQAVSYILGVLLLTTKNAFVPVKRVYSVNTYEFQLSHEGVSEPMNGVSE